jgi:hypothetical protein
LVINISITCATSSTVPHHRDQLPQSCDDTRSIAWALWGLIITAPAGEGMFATASMLTYQVFNSLPPVHRASFRVRQQH